MAWQRSFMADRLCRVRTVRAVPAALGALLLLPALGGCGTPPDPKQQVLERPAPRTVDAAADALFDPALKGISGDTHALLVLQDGKPIVERYAEGFGPQTRFPSWSIAKTVTGLLVGIMVSDGRLALDEPAPVAAWAQPGDPRARITLRHLMTMSSGLRHREGEKPLSSADAVRLLFGDEVSDSYAAARARPVEDPPGSTFRYSSASTQIIAGLLTDQLTNSADPKIRRAAMDGFVRSRLIDPVGLSSLRVEYDAAGTLMGTAFMHMTAQDYARLGELLRKKGNAKGRQIISDRWIEEMTRPSARNAGYGAHLWINRAGAEKALFVGRLPTSVYGATGLWGQMVVVVPDRRLVVVRLGITPTEQEPAMRELIARLIDTVPTN